MMIGDLINFDITCDSHRQVSTVSTPAHLYPGVTFVPGRGQLTSNQCPISHRCSTCDIQVGQVRDGPTPGVTRATIVAPSYQYGLIQLPPPCPTFLLLQHYLSDVKHNTPLISPTPSFNNLPGLHSTFDPSLIKVLFI